MKPVKKDTNRIAKVNSLIQHELGPVLHEFLDWQKGLVTITKVETSRDMKWAKIWISIFHPKEPSSGLRPPSPKGRRQEGLSQADEKAKAAPSLEKKFLPLDKQILDFLAKNIYDIQGEVNKHFHTKIIPRISFHLDVSPRYVEHIDELIKEIHGKE